MCLVYTIIHVIFVVVEFSASSGPWFDPKSWGTNQIHSNDSLRFLLDVEKVPCSQDRVIFPDYNSFVVDMEAKQLSIGSMLIHNEVGRPAGYHITVCYYVTVNHALSWNCIPI